MKQKEKKKSKNISGDESLSELPRRYNIDTIMIMPVNVDTSFIYWEITDRLLNSKLRELNVSSANLMIKVFETGLRKEIYSFKMKDRIGKRYINYHTSFKPLTAEAGILKDNEFIGILKSKKLSGPSIATPATKDENPLSCMLLFRLPSSRA